MSQRYQSTTEKFKGNCKMVRIQVAAAQFPSSPATGELHRGSFAPSRVPRLRDRDSAYLPRLPTDGLPRILFSVYEGRTRGAQRRL